MKIKAITHALPTRCYEASEVADWTGAHEDFISEKVGAARRYFLDSGQRGVDLAYSAVCKLLSDQDLKIDDVSLLIYVTQTPDHGIPHNSAILHGMLSGSDSLASFDVGLGCSGYPYAISIAKSMMMCDGFERAIVVTCDPYSKIMDRRDKATAAVFGDAATATLLAYDGHVEIGKADFGTRGANGEAALLLKRGNAAYPIRSIHSEYPELSGELEEYSLFMNGRNVFNFVMSEIPKSIERALEKNDSVMSDIGFFALHQGSAYMLRNLVRRAGIDDAKVIYNIQRFGNTVSSSVPLVLEDIMRNNPDFSGKVLISGFGVGVSWASNVLTFK